MKLRFEAVERMWKGEKGAHARTEIKSDVDVESFFALDVP